SSRAQFLLCNQIRGTFLRWLVAEITMMLGGRAAEEIILHEVTTGAQSDLEQATSMARKMVTQFGMSDKLGNVSLGKNDGPVFLGLDISEKKNYSDTTARIIDEEVRYIVDEAYHKAKDMLKSKQDKLQILATALIEKEVMNGEEVKTLLGIQKPDTA
ncbi:MAG: hypothetical protein NTY14_04225, partial [Candidatus Omnitrophica bacterium]|nr:hypothetical protein [Candidatus Omnitrophota bacterium]